MFRINRYRYKGHGKQGKGKRVEVFARTQEFADGLVERMNKVLGYNFKPKLFGFVTKFYTDQPPYEIEQYQEEGMTKLEEDIKKHEQEELHQSN